MDTTIDHHVNHALKINYNIVNGEIQFEDFVKDLDKIIYGPQYNDSYNILIDIREANFIDFSKKVFIFVDYIQNNARYFNMNRKCSFITTKPLDVVHATLLIEKLHKIGFQIKFKIFSTEEAALEWIVV